MGGLGGGGFGGSPTGHAEIGYRPPSRRKRSKALGGGGVSDRGVEKPRDGGGRGGGGRGGGGRGGGGGIDLTSLTGGGTGVSVGGVERPDLPPIDPQAAKDPELEAYAQKYGGHITDLKEGTGFAMDVLSGQMQDQKQASQERAMASAAQAGIPFDAGSWGAEYDRGINSAMASEKLGREKMLTDAYQGGLPIVSRPSEERFARLDLDLKRDLGESGDILKRYGIDVGKYGKDVDAAIGSNNALLGFLSNLMGSVGSYSGGSYSYG